MNNELIFTKDELLEMYKLKDIVRYNHRTRLKNENVAEHSFFTTLITLELCKRLNLSNDITLSCVIKALLHDMPETELNDITYDVKLKLNLYPLLKKFEDEFFEREFADYASLMNNNENNIVNLVVKYADALSVLQYSYNEIELGNTKMHAIIEETISRLSEIKLKLLEVTHGNI